MLSQKSIAVQGAGRWSLVEAVSSEKAILRYFEILEATYRSCIVVTDYNCLPNLEGIRIDKVDSGSRRREAECQKNSSTCAS